MPSSAIAAARDSLPDPDAVMAVIREVAATVITPRFRNLVEADVRIKTNPKDLVTVADVAAEKRLAAAFTTLVPGSVVVGEEAADHDPSLIAALGTATPAWVIDPIDGTYNFVQGTPCFATIVAFCIGGRTLAGWIHNPLSGETTWAVAGGGAYCEDRRIAVASSGPVPGFRGTGSRSLRQWVDRQRAAGVSMPAEMVHLGCTGEEYARLCRGEMHFAQWTRLKPWDHAAGILIHREAGGFSAMVADGSPYCAGPALDPGTVLVAPDRASWEALRPLLRMS